MNLIQDYTLALDLLDDYDHQRLSLSQTKKSAKKIITYEQALNAINTLREKFRKDGESVDLFGKEKDQSFKSSLSTIYQTFEKKELYPSIEEKAAHLLYFVIKNHSFVDGNKRIAAFIFVWFFQPEVAILLFLTSNAKAMFFGYFLQHVSKNFLSFIAAVPNIILSAPISTNFETLLLSLIPPPSSTFRLNFLILVIRI